mmetsp:Transcript_3334/g.5766  ORF Transcript_3334/g.5766 Transcript_3334/m.5766 type:complete len:355 (-) Transcript_3334:572-1636(-)
MCGAAAWVPACGPGLAAACFCFDRDCAAAGGAVRTGTGACLWWCAFTGKAAAPPFPPPPAFGRGAAFAFDGDGGGGDLGTRATNSLFFSPSTVHAKPGSAPEITSCLSLVSSALYPGTSLRIVPACGAPHLAFGPHLVSKWRPSAAPTAASTAALSAVPEEAPARRGGGLLAALLAASAVLGLFCCCVGMAVFCTHCVPAPVSWSTRSTQHKPGRRPAFRSTLRVRPMSLNPGTSLRSSKLNGTAFNLRPTGALFPICAATAARTAWKMTFSRALSAASRGGSFALDETTAAAAAAVGTVKETAVPPVLVVAVVLVAAAWQAAAAAVAVHGEKGLACGARRPTLGTRGPSCGTS